MKPGRGLRRITRRDPRLTAGGFFALVAAMALVFGLSHRGPAGLDVATTPRPHPVVSTGASPLPPDTPTAPATTATTAPAATATPASGELAAAHATPGHTSAATAAPTANPWIEATPPPDTPAPPTPTPPQGRCNVSMGGNCEFPPPPP